NNNNATAIEMRIRPGTGRPPRNGTNSERMKIRVKIMPPISRYRNKSMWIPRCSRKVWGAEKLNMTERISGQIHSMDEIGKTFKQGLGEGDHLRHQPRAGQGQRHEHPDKLRDKGQRLLLNLSRGLHQADH